MNFSDKHKLRNVALVGHGHSGKTMVAERLLFHTGATKRLGNIEDGTTVSDHDSEETRRQSSISLSVVPVHYEEYKINLLDSPGYADYIGEVACALRAVETAAIVVDASSGVQVQTELVWNIAQDDEISTLIIISKLDKEHTDYESTLDQCRTKFGNGVVPLYYPIGKEAEFTGLVNILTKKAYTYNDGVCSEIDVPSELSGQISSMRDLIVEKIVETKDDLTERYLDGSNISDEELHDAFHDGVASRILTPVIPFSATKGVGAEQLLHLITHFLPTPEEHTEYHVIEADGTKHDLKPGDELRMLCFKTQSDPYVGKLSFMRIISGTLKTDSAIINVNQDAKERIGHIFIVKGKEQTDVKQALPGDIVVLPKIAHLRTGDTLNGDGVRGAFVPIDIPPSLFQVAIEPKAKTDEEKLGTSLNRIAEEDRTIKVARDPVTRQTVLSAQGDQHVEVVLSRLKNKFGVEAELHDVKIAYKETIRSSAKAQGKYKKQSGGRGQYGDVWLELGPAERASGFVFQDKIVGGVVPRNYIPAVEKGVKETMEHGVLAGCEVVDIQCTLYDGSYHAVDSSEMAFKIAASMAFRNAFKSADPAILEPIVEASIKVPEEYMGDVIGDVSARRGKVLGMEPDGRSQKVQALIPQAEMAKYPVQLRSLTHGKGSFDLKFSHYEDVTPDVMKKIIEESGFSVEEE